MDSKRPLGVSIFGILLVITSLLQLRTVMVYGQFGYYKQLFAPMSEQVLLVRYIVSMGLRILGLVAGIGVLSRREVFRKIILFNAYFTIFTIYWKHPFFAVKKHAQVVADIVSKRMDVCEVVFPQSVHMIALAAFVFLNGIDLAFSACLIYYFTRPAVRVWFK